MVPLNDEILVAFINADRFAAIERAYLTRSWSIEQASAGASVRPFRATLVQAGRLLVRAGHWLECLGGDCAAGSVRGAGQAGQIVRA